MEETRPAISHRPSGMNPFFLNLTLIAILSMLVIFAATGYGIFRVYQGHIVRNAKEDAINLCEVLIIEHRDLFFTTGAGGRSRLSIPPPTREVLNWRLSRYLTPFQIVKLKLYDTEGRILFSTDPQIIGEIDDGNFRLQQALQGQPDSHLENKDLFRDLSNEPLLDVDVVETYVPILVDGNVLGAFEIYRDVTPYRQEIVTTVTPPFSFWEALCFWSTASPFCSFCGPAVV